MVNVTEIVSRVRKRRMRKKLVIMATNDAFQFDRARNGIENDQGIVPTRRMEVECFILRSCPRSSRSVRHYCATHAHPRR